MDDKPELTPDFCLHAVINSTPYPSRFKDGDDPTELDLEDMGIVDDLGSALFIQLVKSRIAPWHIDNTSIEASRDTKLQAAADSIQSGAF